MVTKVDFPDVSQLKLADVRSPVRKVGMARLHKAGRFIATGIGNKNSRVRFSDQVFQK